MNPSGWCEHPAARHASAGDSLGRRTRAPRRGALAALAMTAALLLVGCGYLPFRRQPPHPGRTTLDSPLVILSEETIGNFAVIEAKWDRYGPYHFVIDTGSANTLVTPALIRRYGTGTAPLDAPSIHVASADGRVLELPTATLRKLELGGAKFEDVPVLEYDLAQLSAHLGVRIDGLLGFPLFRDTRLTLDYPHNRVLLQPADADAATPGTPVPFDDTTKTPLIYIGLGNRRMLVLVDSGSDGTFSVNPVGLDTPFAVPPAAGATVGTLAGDHPQEIGRLGEDIVIGDYTVQRPIVDLTDELSAIGGGLLRYFTVTFDARHDRVTFLRDTHAPIVLPPRRSAGVSFTKTPAYWRVAGVIPNSPAAAAGIQFGDLVTRINGEPVARWNLNRYEETVKTASEVTFTLLFGTKEVEKRVAVFSLVP